MVLNQRDVANRNNISCYFILYYFDIDVSKYKASKWPVCVNDNCYKKKKQEQ